MRKRRTRRRGVVLSPAKWRQLLEAAKAVRQQAFAKYSKFRVGAAILTAKGNVYPGCNVENASYGMTNCAERTAIFSAVAQEGRRMRVLAVAVANGRGPCSPCGACRQVIFQFGPEAVVLFKGPRGWRKSHITELLPYGFRL